MNCPKCNKPNREKAVFCKWCGTNVVTKATCLLYTSDAADEL